MKHLMHKKWTEKRVKKIIDIFGESWFKNKQILEMGACHGDIGIELLHLGSEVTFSDANDEYLQSITNKLEKYNYHPIIKNINQEHQYNLNKKFDLILHLGLLYNLKNWKQDLKCCLSHTNIMILESMVNPVKDSPELHIFPPNTSEIYKSFKYGSYEDKGMTLFTQEDVEKELLNLKCKFLRFDNSELNSSGWLYNGHMTNFLYDWNYDNYQIFTQKSSPENVTNHFRRMWLVLK